MKTIEKLKQSLEQAQHACEHGAVGEASEYVNQALAEVEALEKEQQVTQTFRGLDIEVRVVR